MKRKTLMAYSDSYFQENDVYETFSQAEDAPGKIFAYLKKQVANKDLLDIGCGTGKYTQLLAPYATHITGIDASDNQIQIARRKTKGCKNVTCAVDDASEIRLGKEHFDIIIWCRFLSTVTSKRKQILIIKNLTTALKPWGKIVLIENATSGEFERIREKQNLQKNPTKQYQDWILSKGFVLSKKIKTHFMFESFIQAKEVFTSIWWIKKGNNVKSKKIGLDVIVLEYKKQ